MTYKSHDTAGVNDRGEPVNIRVAIKLLNREIAPEVIKLKVRNILVYGETIHQLPSLQVGCQVMLVKVGYFLLGEWLIGQSLMRDSLESYPRRIGQRVHRSSGRLPDHT